MKKAHAMLFKLSQQVENGGANCEDSKRFRLCWKGGHTAMASEWKMSSPNRFMKDKPGFDSFSNAGAFFIKPYYKPREGVYAIK